MHLHLHILICGWFVDIIIELTYNTNKRNVLRGGNGRIFRFPCWGGDGDAKHLSDKLMERRECYVTVKFICIMWSSQTAQVGTRWKRHA